MNMPKDFANIYNLTEEDFKAETQNLWKDAIPGTLELANNLLKKIEDDEYPYVLSVEASYGMGKTYFFSRFCEHAKKNGYHCIYISAWENDYQPSPFCFIAKEILNYFTMHLRSSVNSSITTLKEKVTNVAKKILLSSSIQVGVNLKFFSIGIENNLEKLCKSFLETKDEVKEFKKELAKILVNNRIKPLIIIIDELDRCRPDYALKTLEIIKHFFDLDNLYVILPVNNEALVQAVQSTYGDIKNSEYYMRKFITENYLFPTSDEKYYKKIVETHISKTKLKNIIKKKVIEDTDGFNGYNTVIENITKYAYKGKLTYRELINVCNEFVCLSNKINKKIMAEYLIYKLCSKYNDKLTLDTNHPFADSSYGLNTRQNMLSIKDLSRRAYNLDGYLEYNSFEKNYHQEVNSWNVGKDNFATYKEFYIYIDNVLKYKDDILKSDIRRYNGREKFLELFNLLETAKSNAMQYQYKYGSSDDDANEQSYYDKIIENSLCLY